MTDQNEDPKVSQRISQAYRELGAEQPPRALDDAILAAARRSARPWNQRWAVPLSLAAVVVLSVAVTLRIQHEQPDIEIPVPQVAPPVTVKKAVKEGANEAAKPLAAEQVKTPRRKSAEPPAPPAAAASSVPVAPDPKPFAADQAAAPSSARADASRRAAAGVTGTLARQVEERTSRDADTAAAPQLGAAQALAKRSEVELAPERELERIAGLRAQGRHDEADRALAEFRKRYPDYRMTDALRERVERR